MKLVLLFICSALPAYTMELPQNPPVPVNEKLGILGRLPSELLVKIFADPFNTTDCADDKVRNARIKISYSSALKLLGSCRWAYQENDHLTRSLVREIHPVVPVLYTTLGNFSVLHLLYLPTPVNLRWLKQLFVQGPDWKKFYEDVFLQYAAWLPPSGIRMLLDADIYKEGDNNKYMIMTAILNKLSPEKIKIMLDHPNAPDINVTYRKGGMNAMHVVAEMHSRKKPEAALQIARLLLAKEINYKLKDAQGYTPLDYARERDSSQLEKLLSEKERQDAPRSHDWCAIS